MRPNVLTDFSSSLSCMPAWAFNADKLRHLPLPLLWSLPSSFSDDDFSRSGVCPALLSSGSVDSSTALKMSSSILGRNGDGSKADVVAMMFSPLLIGHHPGQAIMEMQWVLERDEMRRSEMTCLERSLCFVSVTAE